MVQAHLSARRNIPNLLEQSGEVPSLETIEKEIVVSDLEDMEPEDESYVSEGLPTIDESAVDESAE